MTGTFAVLEIHGPCRGLWQIMHADVAQLIDAVGSYAGAATFLFGRALGSPAVCGLLSSTRVLWASCRGVRDGSPLNTRPYEPLPSCGPILMPFRPPSIRILIRYSWLAAHRTGPTFRAAL